MPELPDIVVYVERLQALADRSLSRLLKADWPRTLEELEEGRVAARLTTTETA